MTSRFNSITFKVTAGIVMLLAVFSFVVGAVGYRNTTDVLLEQYSEGAFYVAETAAEMVDGNSMPGYIKSEGRSAAYTAVRDRLDRLCNSTGCTFVYVIVPDTEDYGHITFIFSLMNRESSYTHYDFGYYRETTNDDYRMKYRALWEGTSDRELVIRDKGYIETDPHLTAMVPVKDWTGKTCGILCVQRQMEAMASARRTYLAAIVTSLLIMSVVSGIALSLYLSRTVLKPLKNISEEADRFAGENVKKGRKLRETIRNRDEIGVLADSIDKMEEQVQSYVENLTAVTAENERISTELSLAARIQDDMLPGTFPAFPERREFDLFASMDPAKEVGGDFYDFFLIDEDHLCILIADVSGKGVPAALFMMASKILLESNAVPGRTAAEILKRTNDAVCAGNRENMFVTVWLGILEISTGRLNAANAGHEYPVIRRPGEPFELYKDRHGLVIGALPETNYRDYELTLEPGAKIFVYTDGLPEATRSDAEMFGTERMLASLNEQTGSSPREILGAVQSDVSAFVRDADQFDDLTMLCLEYLGDLREQ